MAKNWIGGAIRHKGALTASAHAAGMSPMAFAEAHKHDSGKTGNRARLAITLRGLGKKNGRAKRRARTFLD